MPGISRSMTASVASGVTSRGETPVPPVVTMRSIAWSHRETISSLSKFASSGTISRRATCIPRLSRISATTTPLVSSRSPAAPLADTVTTAAWYVWESLPAMDLRSVPVEHLDVVPDRGLASLEHPGEDALARHDAVADRLADGAGRVALLADLGDLDGDVLAYLQVRAYRQRHQLDPLGGNVLGEVAGPDVQPLEPHLVDALHRQQAHLPVPLAGVRVTLEPLSHHEQAALHVVFLFPGEFGYVDRDNFPPVAHLIPPVSLSARPARLGRCRTYRPTCTAGAGTPPRRPARPPCTCRR